MTKIVSCPKEKDKPKKKNGRPPKKTDEMVKRILDYISKDGLTVRKACQLENISPGTFTEWILKDKDLSVQYDECMRIRNETMAQEIIDIADCVSEDDVFDENGNRRANAEWIARSRLRIDTRKWLLSKMLPKKYGDKIDVNNSGEVNHNNTLVIEYVSAKAKE